MSFLFSFLKPLVKSRLKKELSKQSNKNQLVDLVNDKVDLPKMDEEEEKEFFDKLYDILSEHALKIVDRM